MVESYPDASVDKTYASSTKPSNWFELNPPTGDLSKEIGAEILEGIYHTLAESDDEITKPQEMAPLAIQVVHKLASLYPSWKDFPSACMRNSNFIFNSVIKQLHNKFASGHAAPMIRTVQRMR